jgi:hypothetical protein
MNNVDSMTVGIANLFRSELEHCAGWPSDRLLSWVRWFVVKQRYLVSVRDGELVGAALLRYVDDEEGCRSDYCDTGGKICYVDATAAREKGVMRDMFTDMWKKIGKDCDLIAWVRPKHDSKIICVPMDKARRRLIKE